MYRNIIHVHNFEIKHLIQNDTLTYELDNYITSLWNIAPEVLCCAESWQPYLDILNHHVPTIKYKWQLQIANILNPNKKK